MQKFRFALLVALPALALAACGQQARQDEGRVENAARAVDNAADQMGAMDENQFQATDATIRHEAARVGADVKVDAGAVAKDAVKDAKAVEAGADRLGDADKAQFHREDVRIDRAAAKIRDEAAKAGREVKGAVGDR